MEETNKERPPTAAELYTAVRNTLSNLPASGSGLARTLLILIQEAGIVKVEQAAERPCLLALLNQRRLPRQQYIT